MSAVQLATQSQGNSPDSIADAARLFGDDPLTRRFAPVFARIAEGAVQREQQRELAYEPVECLREADYTRLRVPQQYGGEGIVSISLHPGVIKTDLARNSDSFAMHLFGRMMSYDVSYGAISSLYAGTAPAAAELNGKVSIPASSFRPPVMDPLFSTSLLGPVSRYPTRRLSIPVF